MNASPALPRRRTQQQRSSAMRARLLEATVECLNERGFSGTTTTEISERAGVSRGAQLHHYPTKRELVTAAIEHVLDRRLAEFKKGFARAPRDASTRVQTAVDRLWALTSGPTFYAWLELLVAARTDAALRESMRGIARRFDAHVIETFKEAFPAQAEQAALHLAPWFTLATMHGFALERILDADDPRPSLGLKALAALGARAFKHAEESFK